MCPRKTIILAHSHLILHMSDRGNSNPTQLQNVNQRRYFPPMCYCFDVLIMLLSLLHSHTVRFSAIKSTPRRGREDKEYA